MHIFTIWISLSELYHNKLYCIYIRHGVRIRVQWPQMTMVEASNHQVDYANYGCSLPTAAISLTPSYAVASCGHNLWSYTSTNSYCRKAPNWGFPPSTTPSCRLCSSLLCFLLADLLFLTGLASSVFLVSEFIKLCEKRCCRPKHTKGCHNWCKLPLKIYLEWSWDAG